MGRKQPQQQFIYYCERQEEPAIIISRLLLRIRRHVASFRLDFSWTFRFFERNLVTHVVTICNVKHNAQRWSKSVLTFDRCRVHSVTFGYYCSLSSGSHYACAACLYWTSTHSRPQSPSFLHTDPIWSRAFGPSFDHRSEQGNLIYNMQAQYGIHGWISI